MGNEQDNLDQLINESLCNKFAVYFDLICETVKKRRSEDQFDLFT